MGRTARARGRSAGLGQPHVPTGRRALGAVAERRRLRPRGREGAAGAAVPRTTARRRAARTARARRPRERVPFPWSVRRWIDGTVALRAVGLDRRAFAADVAAVLRQLRAIPAGDGPIAGAHSFHRGTHPSYYASDVVAALDRLGGAVDRRACERVWEQAVATTWEGPGVWFHGDVAPGNLLVDDHGRLAALIDFGTCGVGDPACDLVLAWTFLDEGGRRVFRDAVGLDVGTWARARGWALWKSLIMLAGSAGPGDRAEHEAVLATVLADPVA
ncbi:phosphotransferase [Curtobacterium flaccumfaciens]|nr:phosphotransferase [Curtobacterium flaccumfaciens]